MNPRLSQGPEPVPVPPGPDPPLRIPGLAPGLALPSPQFLLVTNVRRDLSVLPHTASCRLALVGSPAQQAPARGCLTCWGLAGALLTSLRPGGPLREVGNASRWPTQWQTVAFSNAAALRWSQPALVTTPHTPMSVWRPQPQEPRFAWPSVLLGEPGLFQKQVLVDP